MTLALVTGGAGFIGSHTVDLLCQRGYSVRVLDLLQDRVHPRGRPDYVPTNVDFVPGDVSNRAVMARALDGVDYVFHLAAYQDYLADFSTFIRVNTESTALILELAVERKLPIKKIVLASSQSVAGEGVYACAEHGIVRPGPRPIEQLERGDWEVKCPTCGGAMAWKLIDEETCSPHTAYAISKYAIELLALRLGRRYGIPTVCMRYTYVQGPRNSFFNAYSGILRRFALRVMHDLPPVLYEDGGQVRDYVNVSDVARANVIAMENPEADFAVLNVGGGRPVTVREFARIVLAAFGSNLAPEIPGHFRVGDTRHTISDIARVRRLGWEPTVPVEESVRQYVEWIRDQRGTSEYLFQAERVMREANVIRAAAVG
ncbi:MAG: NAD-dependent epimerase/dehydratase family protein [Chloroflexota bacterium]|nr:MAG: NAD-dependent epimerase/dehydratase family protein [Chloroflexota bacterium]